MVKYRVGMKILPVGDRGGSHPQAESPPLETFRKRPERSERPNSDLRQTKPALQAVRLVLLRAPPFVLLPVPSAHRLRLGCRKSPRRTLFRQPAMPENLLDHLGLPPLDEGDVALKLKSVTDRLPGTRRTHPGRAGNPKLAQPEPNPAFEPWRFRSRFPCSSCSTLEYLASKSLSGHR